jgi:hypothetical protein
MNSAKFRSMTIAAHRAAAWCFLGATAMVNLPTLFRSTAAAGCRAGSRALRE